MSVRDSKTSGAGSLLDRYTQPRALAPSREARPDGSLVTETYAVMLDLVLRNGNHYALPYATLLRALYNPSTGIRLVFSTDDVHIEGRNLGELHRGITQHRVQRIVVEGSDASVAWSEGGDEPKESVVTAIAVTPKDG
ncbi:MAG: hypothetical protein AAGB48_08485 [Planctomycetota bacterium]